MMNFLFSALYTCEQCLPIYPLADLEKVDKESTGYVIYSCILAILRMLLNITHGNGKDLKIIQNMCTITEPQLIERTC